MRTPVIGVMHTARSTKATLLAIALCLGTANVAAADEPTPPSGPILPVAPSPGAQPWSPMPPPPMPPTTWAPAPGGYNAQPGFYLPPPRPTLKPFSIGRRTTGQILTIIGLAHGLGATITEGLLGFYGGSIIVGPLHGTGAILCAIGAPLWMSGSKLVPAGGSAARIDLTPGVALHPSANGFAVTF